MGSPFTATPKDAVPRFGYEALHFLELTAVGNGYRAIVCSGAYAEFVASRTRPGKVDLRRFNDKTAATVCPRFHRVSSVNHSELTQHGPRSGRSAPAPQTVPQMDRCPRLTRSCSATGSFTGCRRCCSGTAE